MFLLFVLQARAILNDHGIRSYNIPPAPGSVPPFPPTQKNISSSPNKPRAMRPSNVPQCSSPGYTPGKPETERHRQKK
jgi:hypothetical protein